MLEIPDNGLVIIIRDNISDIASVCYKNASQTKEAIKKARDLVSALRLTNPNTSRDCSDIMCALMSFVMDSDGGICEGFFSDTGWHVTEKMFPLEGTKRAEFRDDNMLVTTSEQGIHDMYRACPGTIYVNLDEGNITNETVLWYSDGDDFLEAFDEDFDETIDYDTLPEMDFNPVFIDWSDIDRFCEFIDTNDYTLFKDGDGGIIYFQE